MRNIAEYRQFEMSYFQRYWSPGPSYEGDTWKNDVVDALLDPEGKDSEGIKLMEDAVVAVKQASEKIELLRAHFLTIWEKKEAQHVLERDSSIPVPNVTPENNGIKRKNDYSDVPQSTTPKKHNESIRNDNYSKRQKVNQNMNSARVSKNNQVKKHSVRFCIFDSSIRVQTLIDSVESLGINKSRFDTKGVQHLKNKTCGFFNFKDIDDFEKILQHRCSFVFNGKSLDLRPA